MTDRELLELAAKAAGIDIGWYVMINGARSPIIAPKTQHEKNWLGHEYTEWNPLTDDGDEARLEASLGLNVLWFSDHVIVEAGERISHCEFFEKYDGGKQAARRRAGVRVAASLASSL